MASTSLDKKTEQELLKRWLGWIRRIDTEINEFFLHNHIFWEVQSIIRNNERLSKTPSQFFQWMVEQFVYSSTLFVRRQADKTKRTVSLYKLLEDIRNHPNVLTRERFLKAWGYDETHVLESEIKKQGNELFDEVVGKGQEQLTKAKIKADMDALVANVKKIEDYANNYVAHHSERPTASDLPTFKDLKETMEFLEKLLQKYYLLIAGWKLSSIEERGFRFSYDWKRIFTFPWIETEDKGA